MRCTIYMDRETEAQAWKELQKMNQAGRNWTMEQYIEWLIEDTMRQRKAAEEAGCLTSGQ
jgi:hypothetical protein